MDHYNNSDIEDAFDYRKEFFKYLFFWKYFLFSVLTCLLVAFFINRYTSEVFTSNAKIKILDKKDSAIELPSAEDLFSSSKINLENEIEVIKSYSILEQVVRNRNLTTSVISVGKIKNTLVVDYPFSITSKLPIDSITEMLFKLDFTDKGLEIIDYENEIEYIFKNYNTNGQKHNLPFDISKINKNINNRSYFISFQSIYDVVISLKKDIIVNQVGKASDIISINFNSTNSKYAINILDELIEVFDNDGIKDRQLIHKRTIDFVNERYLYLSLELDSIEVNKELFKVNNDLVDLRVNSEISLEKSSVSEESIFSNENQIFIASSLLDALSKLSFELLPANIGIENMEINKLIDSYNNMILEQKKLLSSAGPNNPSLNLLENSIKDSRSNILFSLQNYLSQLNILKIKLSNQFNKFDNQVTKLPEKEKILRSIERNQEIKEALYLFLLQKREESEVSYAVTEPSIKVVEYAFSDIKPIVPNGDMLYTIALLLGIFIPFGFIYLIFLFDNKVHSREDLDKFSLNVLGEIPFFDMAEPEKVFAKPDDRSIISESFRMLMSNVRYLLKNDSESNVTLVTSSIKGEGKTLNALNLALSFSSVGKKVLLIGCDLRNPQLHKYINHNKNVPGLVDFLVDNTSEWKKSILNPFDSQDLDILLSGPLPPNPLNLINNGNIDILLNDAKKTYDHIIIDSAPTLLVADTQSLINKSDILIFLTRCNVTDNDVLTHIKKLSDVPDANVGVILNGVGQQNSYGYSYGYRYGYGYNYKYSYNYGYGYGYNEES